MAQKIIVKNPKTHLIVTPASKAYFKLKNTGGPVGPTGSQGPQGPQGEQGPQGPQGIQGPKGNDGANGAAATISVGTTTTGQPGTNASVTNSGTSSAAVFNFTIPRGSKGDKGDKGDTGATGAAGTDGAAATIAAGSTTTLPAGSSATVTNSGTSSAAVFNFGIPKGDKGDKGDPGAGLVITGTVATYADLPSGLGPSDAGKAYFVQADGKLYVWTGTAWPADGDGSQFEGPQGPAGQDGAAATVTVGTTTTLPAGSSATVTNVGTTSAAVLNFGIPKGDKGDSGGGGGTGDMSAADYDPNNTVKNAGGIVAYVSDEIPTKTSELTNDGSDGTSTYVEADELATVATTGSYNNLTDKPNIPAAQVNADWNADSGVAQILNKPTIPAAQIQSDWTQADNTAVDYIKNKPAIPVVNDATLTIQHNGTTKATFSSNSSVATTANIETIYADTVAPTATVGAITTANLADDAVTADKIDWATVGDAIYPVGSIVTFYDTADHSNFLGFTWIRFGAGRMIVGYDSADADFDTIGETGGSKTHQHNLSDNGYTLLALKGNGQIRYREKTVAAWQDNYYVAGSGGYNGGDSQSYGAVLGGTTDSANGMPPYIVASLWRRTA